MPADQSATNEAEGRRLRWLPPRGLLLLLATLLIFALLLRHVDLRRTLSLIGEIPARVWILATLISVSFFPQAALRWMILLRALGHALPFSRCLAIVTAAWPLASVTPSKSGDLAKALFLRREASAMVVAGSVLSERALDLLVLAGASFTGALLLDEPRLLLLSGAVLLLILAGALLALVGPPRRLVGERLGAKIEQLTRSARALARSPGVLLVAVLLTALKWATTLIQTSLLFQGVGASVSLGFLTAALPPAIFASLLPVTIAGMGTRDSAMLVLFAGQAEPSQILSVSLLFAFFGLWLPSFMALPVLRREAARAASAAEDGAAEEG